MRRRKGGDSHRECAAEDENGGTYWLRLTFFLFWLWSGSADMMGESVMLRCMCVCWGIG